MRRTCLAEYKKAKIGWPHPVRLSLFLRMNVSLIIRFLIIFLSPVTGQQADYQPFHSWIVVDRNSSGRLLFHPNPLAPRVFAWMPYNASARPTFFYERPPNIIQNPPPKDSPGFDKRLVSPASLSISSEADQTAPQEVSTVNSAGRHLCSTASPIYAALKVSNATKSANVSTGVGDNLLFHAFMMDMLNEQRQAPNLTIPHRESKPFNVTQASNDTHYCLYLKAHVNRRFLTRYNCSNPGEVKPISSFVRDPCEPAEANERDTYEIDPPTQYQIVQYETRREFQGTRCEKYISQFTYYCGAADHSSPLPPGNLF